jgi:protein-S-isoprenylcysteine O-methyltransferase Ste14
MSQAGTETGAARPPLLERFGHFFFAHRNLVFPLVLAVLLGALRPVPFMGSPRADRWLDVLGLLIALTGQALRVAVIGYAYIRRGGKNRKVYADDLVTEGFFNHCRNPLYVGNLLVLTGLFVIHHNPVTYLLGLPFFLFAYAAIVAAEEAYLRRHFGDEYAAYLRRVPRWLPDVRGLRKTVAGMQFDWNRVIVKEYTSTFSWVAAAIGLLAYEVLLEAPYPGHPTHLAALAALFFLAAALWTWAYYYKKSDKHRRRRQTAPEGP